MNTLLQITNFTKVALNTRPPTLCTNNRFTYRPFIKPIPIATNFETTAFYDSSCSFLCVTFFPRLRGIFVRRGATFSIPSSPWLQCILLFREIFFLLNLCLFVKLLQFCRGSSYGAEFKHARDTNLSRDSLPCCNKRCTKNITSVVYAVLKTQKHFLRDPRHGVCRHRSLQPDSESDDDEKKTTSFFNLFSALPDYLV